MRSLLTAIVNVFTTFVGSMDPYDRPVSRNYHAPGLSRPVQIAIVFERTSR